MSETEQEQEPEVPGVADVPEPDQDPDEEHEEAEAEAAETHEPEPEPEPEAQATTPEEWEKRFAAAERRFKTYTDAITKIWEEDALNLIPFNLDPAAPPGFIDARNKGHVEDDTKAAALAFLGFDEGTGLNVDPYSHVCETCGGEGLLDTRSKVPNQGTRGCNDCRGVGYVMDIAEVPATNGAFVGGAPPEGSQLVPAATGVESPEVESLRLRGYTIIPPMRTES